MAARPENILSCHRRRMRASLPKAAPRSRTAVKPKSIAAVMSRRNLAPHAPRVARRALRRRCLAAGRNVAHRQPIGMPLLSRLVAKSRNVPSQASRP